MQPNHSDEFDLILPCYNPLENWDDKILASLEEIEQLAEGINIHLILVNDGSTVELAPDKIKRLSNKIARFTFLTNPTNKGKGNALRLGVKQSNNPLCMFTDIDFPYTPESFVKMYHALRTADCGIAVGIREDSYYSKTPYTRKVISKLLKKLIKSFFRLKVADTQCGLKGFNSKGKELFLETTIDRYLFDLEFIQLASKKLPSEIKGIPVELKDDVVFSKINSKIILQEGGSFLKIFFSGIFK